VILYATVLVMLLSLPTTYIAWRWQSLSTAKNKKNNKPFRKSSRVRISAVRWENRPAFRYVSIILHDAKNGIIPCKNNFLLAENALESATLENPLMAKGFLRDAFAKSRSGHGLGTCAFDTDQLLKQLAH